MKPISAEELQFKSRDAYTRSSNHLADGNAADERGNKARADRCYELAQYWFDRYNKLIGGPKA